MDIYEISGYRSGIDDSGVNFLDPADAFKTLLNGYVYRQQIVSRKGFIKFGSRLPAIGPGNTRVMGIFENVIPNETNVDSRELLVCDQNYLYRYDEGTDAFIIIPFAGSAAAFGITSNTDYVSGTTYLDALGNKRFIFTSRGMTDIYWYDGTDVRSFTMDLVAPIAGTTGNQYVSPPGVALSNATMVFWFGERLNLLIPTLDSVSQQQTMLYSAIRNSDGDGDSFAAVGSGSLVADTYEIMKGGAILGNQMVLNFQRSNWTVEKTRDIFRPYFVRKVPSVLGTDAGFSVTQWAYEVKSVGNTGLITTDGRISARYDNLIPYFTQTEIDQEQIELTYGGFDRNDGQFLFSYLSNTSSTGDLSQDKVLVFNYEFSTFSINDSRFSVFGQTVAGHNYVWDDIDGSEKAEWSTWKTTEEIWNKIGLEKVTQKTLAGDDLGFVYEINTGNDDYFAAISAISQATPGVVTINASAFKAGDLVTFEQIEGMTELNGVTARVVSATTTSLTLDKSTLNFTAYTTSGFVSKLIDFKAETTVFNPYRPNGMKCNLSHLEFLVNTNVGDIYVDIYENTDVPDEKDIEESEQGQSAFKTVLIDTEDTSEKERKWVTVIVNDEADFFKFVMRKQTHRNQKVINAIRIHCSPGGLNAG